MSANKEPEPFLQEFMAWVSQRNPHIPLSDIEYLMDMSFLDSEDFMSEEVHENE